MVKFGIVEPFKWKNDSGASMKTVGKLSSFVIEVTRSLKNWKWREMLGFLLMRQTENG